MEYFASIGFAPLAKVASFGIINMGLLIFFFREIENVYKRLFTCLLKGPLPPRFLGWYRETLAASSEESLLADLAPPPQPVPQAATGPSWEARSTLLMGSAAEGHSCGPALLLASPPVSAGGFKPRHWQLVAL